MASLEIKKTVELRLSLTGRDAENLKALMQNIHPNYMDNAELVSFAETLFNELREALDG